MSDRMDERAATASAPREASESPSLLDALSAPIDVLPMFGRPFGRDESGRKLGHGSGRPTVGVVRHLVATVEERARREAPAEFPAAEIDARVLDAHGKALTRLVELLNPSINDERCRLTEAMLFD